MSKPTSIAPLVTFRVVFGLIMFLSILRFWAMGWIESLLLEPQFHFKYIGFEWVPFPSEFGLYFLFILLAGTSLFVMLGFLYRLSMATFFVAFTYVELLDATYYLNHYYFISSAAFLMMFLPAHRHFSLDVKWKIARPATKVPCWVIVSLMTLIGIVYCSAGIAKLNADWLLHAMPLTIWLPAHATVPLIGPLLELKWVAYAFSWGGALYDLSIPFLLLFARTRPFAFVAVVAFHLITWLLFPIGMFPFIMIGITTIFFSPQWHQRWQGFFTITSSSAERVATSSFPTKTLVAAFVLFQLIFPWRYLLNDGNVYWNEEGYRFGWRVMLCEKAGLAQFEVVDAQSGRSIAIDNDDYLTPIQQKMMATQPDFIAQYAQFLDRKYSQNLDVPIAVRADVFVTLNGRPSQRFLPKNLALNHLSISETYRAVLPLNPPKG